MIRPLYAVAAATILFASCSESGTAPTVPTPPTAPAIRGYNEVSNGSGWIRAELDDYPPGTVVTILGGGWEPGETVTMILSDEPDVQEDRVLTSVADESGGFVNTDFSTTEIHVGVTFTVAAEGQTSGMTASTMFDDGAISDAAIEMRENTCTTAQGSVTTGTAICAFASFTIAGSGGTPAQFRWKSPAGTIVHISQRPSNFPNGTSGSQTYGATFTPTTAGIWTVYLCDSANTDVAFDGDARCAGNTSTNPLGATHRATQTFTATAPPSDTSPPSIGYVLDPASPDGDNGWYKTNVSITWTVTENESPGSLTTVGCVDQTISADQAETPYTCSASSTGGSAGPISVSIKRDGTAPNLAFASASPAAPNGSNGWYTSDVTATFIASDVPSGLADPSQASFTVQSSTEGSAVSIASGSVADNAGNVTASVDAGPFKIDKTAPDVAVTGVGNGAIYTLGTVPAAGCSTTDALSGVAMIASLSQSGGPVGPVTATCSGGTDNAGNVAGAKSVTYTVLYAFVGFSRPVDNPEVLNVAKAGQAIPLKWRLTDGLGNPILNLATVKVTVSALSCAVGDSQDLLEEYASGSSGLQNLGDGYYQFNWKTPAGYAKSCKTMKLDLGEGPGQEHSALFQFTR